MVKRYQLPLVTWMTTVYNIVSCIWKLLRFYFFIVYSITVVPIFSLLPLSTHPSPPPIISTLSIISIHESVTLSFLFLRFYLFTFRERKGGREGNINVWLPLKRPLLGNLTSNPDMCSNWELNQRPFGSQAGTQSTGPHQPGPFIHVLWLIPSPSFLHSSLTLSLLQLSVCSMFSCL